MQFRTEDPWSHSHHDLIQHYYTRYDQRVANGEIRPFLYPWGTFGALVVIIYLLIPHQNRPWLRNCRYLAFIWITWFAVNSIRYMTARLVAAAFGVGLISAWSVMWVCAILVCNDCQTDFMRIERTEGMFGGTKSSMEKKEKDQSNGNTEPLTSKSSKQEGVQTSQAHGHAGPSDRHGEFAWQPYPMTPFIERLDWVLDLFCNFRGAGWNWRTSALPPPPKWVQLQLQSNSGSAIPKHSNRIHPGQMQTYPSRRALLTANLKTLILGYLLLDMLKTTMMHDPYFWGLVSRPPPTHTPFLPSFITRSPVLTHIYRLTLSMLAIKTALQTIFSLGPLFFSGLLGPRLLGARAAHFMYPETWASYTIVLDNGLAGWWSSWWHQTFRFAFEQPSRKIIEVLGWQKSSVKAKALQLFVAFGLSGVVHASGSYTCSGETQPLRGPMAFFLLQACGVLCEVLSTQTLQKSGIPQRSPKKVRQAATFVYVHVWFYFTAHLLCDDFARGGIWLFEPIPVSPLRGLGFGADRRDGWWCWGPVSELLRWHSDEKWWRSGIAF